MTADVGAGAAAHPGRTGTRLRLWALWGWISTCPVVSCGPRIATVASPGVPSAVGAFASWLADHGQTTEVPRTDRVQVIEEVGPTTVDGYERNLIFAFDRRAVTADEIDRTVDWLGYARDDLALRSRASRRGKRSMARCPLATSQRRAARPSGDEMAERSGSDVLRHIGGAELWLAARMHRPRATKGRRGTAISGPGWRGPGSGPLSGSGEAFAIDPAMMRTDPKGEAWTLAKVLRRLISA